MANRSTDCQIVKIGVSVRTNTSRYLSISLSQDSSAHNLVILQSRCLVIFKLLENVQHSISQLAQLPKPRDRHKHNVEKTNASTNEGEEVVIVRVATMASSNANTPVPDAGSELFDEAVASIAQERRISFGTSTNCATDRGVYVGELIMRCPRYGFLHVTGVKEEVLDRALSNFPFRQNLRVSLEDGSGYGVAILTFSPSVTHEVASGRFFVEILERVSRIPGHDLHSLEGVGAGRFHCSGWRSKEGDDAIMYMPTFLQELVEMLGPR